MRFRFAVVFIAAALGIAGCGGPAPTPPAPLSVADWKAMPADHKYTPETLERLKEGDPKLQTPEGWEAFQKTVVQPARKKDLPVGKAK